MQTNARGYVETTPSLTTTAAAILAENRERKALIIFNTSAVTIYFGIGDAYIPIDAGSHVAFTNSDCPINALVAKSASGTVNVVVWEA